MVLDAICSSLIMQEKGLVALESFRRGDRIVSVPKRIALA
jgi:hypothetical protein